MSEPPPDRVLVERTRRGETQAYGELVRRYQRSVFNVCYRMMGERRDAEDMAQEAFVRAYQRLDTFDLGRPFGPWIRRVTANLCLNRLQRGSLPRVPLDDEMDMPETSSIGLELRQVRRESAARVRAAVLALPPHYRVVVEMRHFQELSYAEMAAALDLPLNTVRSHLFRARKLLAERLTDDG